MSAGQYCPFPCKIVNNKEFMVTIHWSILIAIIGTPVSSLREAANRLQVHYGKPFIYQFYCYRKKIRRNMDLHYSGHRNNGRELHERGPRVPPEQRRKGNSHAAVNQAGMRKYHHLTMSNRYAFLIMTSVIFRSFICHYVTATCFSSLWLGRSRSAPGLPERPRRSRSRGTAACPVCARR